MRSVHTEILMSVLKAAVEGKKCSVKFRGTINEMKLIKEVVRTHRQLKEAVEDKTISLNEVVSRIKDHKAAVKKLSLE